MRTYYQILNVGEKASQQEIKVSYKKLAVKYHPDKNPGNLKAEEQFKLVNEAYQVLSDETKKFMYDQRLYAQRSSPQSFGGGGSYQGMGGGYMRGSRNRRASWQQHRRYQQANMRHGDKPKSRVRPVYDPKEDQWKGVVGAIGILGSIALVISVCIALYNVGLRLEKSAVIKEQAVFLSSIRRYHKPDSISAKLQSIDQRIEKNGYTPELASFRKSLTDEIKDKANDLYKRGRYQKAIKYLNLWKERFPEDAKWLEPQIFQCYKKMGKFTEAEKTILSMKSRGENKLFVFSELAHLYRDFHRKPIQALNYYDTASQHIIKQYKDTYGEAYAMQIDPSTQSETQYEVFLAKAELEYLTGKFLKAKASAGWAHILRPDNIPPIVYKSRASMALGDQASACDTWREAMDIGHTYFIDSLIKYKCQPN